MPTPTAAIETSSAPADHLRALMRTRCLGLPGAFNGLCARLVRDTGFDAAYVSGAAVTASYGVPDIGLLGLAEFTSVIHQVWLGSKLPIIADADTGFGEAEMVRRVVHEYHRAGAAGLHIEDQVFPKRCGHLDGKALVPTDHFVEKIEAAADARDALSESRITSPESRGPFIVCARTDAFSVEGLDGAIERARAYVEAGADMIFPEGLSTLEGFETFAAAMRDMGGLGLAPQGGPFLLANMTEFGKTPITSLAEFERLGYHTVIWPVSTLRSAMGAARTLLNSLHEQGDVSAQLDTMLTRADLYNLLGYQPGLEWRFGSAD
ncbi:MAG: isocitrate lyase/phosphoenolpyruvate mutase family protein [Planctomycetota bacterium]